MKSKQEKKKQHSYKLQNLLNIKTFDFNQDIDTQLEENIWTPWIKQFNLTSLKNYFNRPNHSQYQSSTHVQLKVRTHSLDVQESVFSTYGVTVIHHVVENLWDNSRVKNHDKIGIKLWEGGCLNKIDKTSPILNH